MRFRLASVRLPVCPSLDGLRDRRGLSSKLTDALCTLAAPLRLKINKSTVTLVTGGTANWHQTACFRCFPCVTMMTSRYLVSLCHLLGDGRPNMTGFHGVRKGGGRGLQAFGWRTH